MLFCRQHPGEEQVTRTAQTKQVFLTQGLNIRGTGTRAGRFLWHFLQMIVAMELGMMVYHLLVSPLLARTPYVALTDAYPLIGYWMMTVFMVLGMLGLMAFHRSSRRYCFEMTLAMIAPIAALSLLVVCALIPGHVLYGIGDPLMFVVMAAYMLYRPHDHGPHQHAAHPSGSEPAKETAEHCAE